MRVDLGRQLKFPEEIAVTSLRLDIVLWSQATRQVALIELTVAWNLPVEVGCRGFPGQSLWRTLGMLGVRETTRKNLVNNIAKQAETASRWLWLKRSERWLN